MRFNTKLAITAGLFAGGILSANAQSFAFQSFGATWIGGGGGYVVAENATANYYNLAGLTAVTALTYQFALGAGMTVAGAGSFSSNIGFTTFTFAGTYSTTGLPQLAISDAVATYTLPGGKIESGTLSDNLFTSPGPTGGPVNYELNTLSAVPEPASFAVLALGGMGLLVRRRRG